VEKKYDVIVIGAGISGLSAAFQCESKGLRTLVIDSDQNVGGRIQNDVVEGFSLERGFQVLIDTYEKADELLDFNQLDLKKFEPGALIYDEKGSYSISDPMRDLLSLPATAFSRVGSLSDKFKLMRLSKDLKKIELDSLFSERRKTTYDYLKELEFSDKIIENFFRPFFGGIFLERELVTDAGMFRFVFRNFAKGSACIPANGMCSIPKQLRNKLNKTDFSLGTKVKAINHEPAVELENGDIVKASKLIIACDPSEILPQMDRNQEWKNTTTMYFKGKDDLPKMNARIGLDTRRKSTINNFARHDEVVPNCAPAGMSLWSVTTRGEAKSEDVIRDLASLLKVESDKLKFLKEYRISKALPVVESPRLGIPPEQTQITENIYLAGDYLTNSSIDGALRSGESAANAIVETLELMA
jgi:phytoene dehydrogenase-like protein